MGGAYYVGGRVWAGVAVRAPGRVFGKRGDMFADILQGNLITRHSAILLCCAPPARWLWARALVCVYTLLRSNRCFICLYLYGASRGGAKLDFEFALINSFNSGFSLGRCFMVCSFGGDALIFVSFFFTVGKYCIRESSVELFYYFMIWIRGQEFDCF